MRNEVRTAAINSAKPRNSRIHTLAYPKLDPSAMLIIYTSRGAHRQMRTSNCCCVVYQTAHQYGHYHQPLTNMATTTSRRTKWPLQNLGRISNGPWIEGFVAVSVSKCATGVIESTYVWCAGVCFCYDSRVILSIINNFFCRLRAGNN